MPREKARGFSSDQTAVQRDRIPSAMLIAIKMLLHRFHFVPFKGREEARQMAKAHHVDQEILDPVRVTDFVCIVDLYLKGLSELTRQPMCRSFPFDGGIQTSSKR